MRPPPEGAASARDRPRHRQPRGCCIFYADRVDDAGPSGARRRSHVVRRRFWPMTTDDILTRAGAGQRLSASEAVALVDCADPRSLMPIAAALRAAGHGRLLPFS